MTNSEKVLVEKLNQLIEANLDNPTYSTDDICHELGISRSHLYRLIKDEYQLSTSLYIRQRKLFKAKVLLDNNNLKIAEISYQLGIDSPQNFSKYFTQEFGISPTEYRKKASSNELENLIQDTDSKPITSKNGILFKQKKYTYFWVSFVVIILIVFGIYFWKNNITSPVDEYMNPEFSENSIAILPFKNLGEATSSYFSEGIMEQIHSSLASINDIKVISTTSSNKYLNTQKTISQIAQDLHVNFLLGGSVFQVNKQVRITIELISAKDDRVVWVKNFEGDTKNIFDYMNTVSKDVAMELNQKLSHQIVRKLDKSPTKNLEAYNVFLQGQQLLQTRTKEKIEASIIKFDKAIKLDSMFADAFSNKAFAYYMLGEDQYMDVETSYKMAEKNALKALRIDVENGRAYAVLGNIYKAQNKWEQAITTFQIALKFSPNDAQINYWYSLVIRSIGQMDEAIKYSTKAVSIDPLASNIYGGHIIGCAYAGRLDMAEKAIKDGELVFNDSYLFYNAKAFYYIKRENYEAALKEFSICQQLNAHIYTKTLIAYTQAKLGQTATVDNYLKTLPKIPDNHKYFAIVYAGLNNKDLCLKYLALAAEKNDSPNYLKISPLFTFLHHESQFNAILQKLGLLNPSIQLK